jgi:hypothetical protein
MTDRSGAGPSLDMDHSLRFLLRSSLSLVAVCTAGSTVACGGSELARSDESSTLASDDAGAASATTDAAPPTSSTGTNPSTGATGYQPSTRRGTLAIDRFGDAACGIATDGTITCWGTSSAATSLAGTYSSLSFADSLCGVATSGDLACIGTTVPAGSDYVRVVTDEGGLRACGLTSAGAVRCTAGNEIPALSEDGPFLDVAIGNDATCLLGAAGNPSCTGSSGHRELTPAGPLRTLQLIEANADGSIDVGNSCGLTAAGLPTCTGYTLPTTQTFSEVSFEAARDEAGDAISGSYCGISAGKLLCAKLDGTPLAAPPGAFEHVAVSMALGQPSPFACATDTTGRITCFLLDGTAGETPVGSPSSDDVFQL